MIPDLPAAELERMLRTIVLIRRFEEAVVAVGHEAEGWYHTAIGQEGTAVAAALAMAPGDYSSTSHRNHAQALARGVAPRALMAEIFGKAAGVNRGFGGSMHVVSPAHGIVANSAMLGGTAPAMVGAALASKVRGERAVAVSWFGDGTVTEGAVHEALCLAALWQVPVVFVCENDRVLEMTRDQATGTVPAREVQDIPAGFNMKVRAVDGTDIGVVHRVLRTAIDDARAGGGPWFVEVRTQAWPGRSTDPVELPGGPTDFELICGLRPVGPQDTAWHVARDPLALLTRELIAEGRCTPERVLALDAEVRDEVDAAVAFAREAPYPDPQTAIDRGRR